MLHTPTQYHIQDVIQSLKEGSSPPGRGVHDLIEGVLQEVKFPNIRSVIPTSVAKDEVESLFYPGCGYDIRPLISFSAKEYTYADICTLTKENFERLLEGIKVNGCCIEGRKFSSGEAHISFRQKNSQIIRHCSYYSGKDALSVQPPETSLVINQLFGLFHGGHGASWLQSFITALPVGSVVVSGESLFVPRLLGFGEVERNFDISGLLPYRFQKIEEIESEQLQKGIRLEKTLYNLTKNIPLLRFHERFAEQHAKHCIVSISGVSLMDIQSRVHGNLREINELCNELSPEDKKYVLPHVIKCNKIK